MTFVKRLLIKWFLNEHKRKLISKTDFYRKYYLIGEDKENYTDSEINKKKINKLSSFEIDELFKILKIENSYLSI